MWILKKYQNLTKLESMESSPPPPPQIWIPRFSSVCAWGGGGGKIENFDWHEFLKNNFPTPSKHQNALKALQIEKMLVRYPEPFWCKKRAQSVDFSIENPFWITSGGGLFLKIQSLGRGDDFFLEINLVVWCDSGSLLQSTNKVARNPNFHVARTSNDKV